MEAKAQEIISADAAQWRASQRAMDEMEEQAQLADENAMDEMEEQAQLAFERDFEAMEAMVAKSKAEQLAANAEPAAEAREEHVEEIG